MNNKISCQQDRPPRPQPLLRQRKTLWFLVSFLVVFTLDPAGAAQIEGTVSGKDGLLAGANVRLEDPRLHSVRPAYSLQRLSSHSAALGQNG